MVPDIESIARSRHFVTMIMRSAAAILICVALFRTGRYVLPQLLGGYLQPLLTKVYWLHPVHVDSGLLLTLALVFGIFAPPIARWLVPMPKHRCPTCGYSLRALTEPRCPECGLQLTPAFLQPVPSKQTAAACE